MVNSLAKYDLIEESLAVRNVNLADVHVLRELKYQLLENKDSRGRPVLGQDALERAQKFCNKVKFITSQNTSRDAQLLNTKHEIRHDGKLVRLDGGESQIFAATENLQKFEIWTADRKCLIALSLWPNCGHIHNRIQGKVVCLERIIRELIQAHGYSTIKDKIAAGYHSVDNAMAAAEAGCEAVFLQDEKTLQQACQGLLVS